jgi:hypothetical protein
MLPHHAPCAGGGAQALPAPPVAREPVTRVHQLLCSSEELPRAPMESTLAAESPVAPLLAAAEGEGQLLRLGTGTVQEMEPSRSLLAYASMRGPAMGRAFQKYYANAAPSAHCHCCARTSRTALFMVCSRLRDGLCRKVICSKCFAKNGWNWQEAAQDNSWTCTHCRDACPKGGSQCFIYARVNRRRIKKSDRIALGSSSCYPASRPAAILAPSYQKADGTPRFVPYMQLSEAQPEARLRDQTCGRRIDLVTDKNEMCSHSRSRTHTHVPQHYPSMDARLPPRPDNSDPVGREQLQPLYSVWTRNIPIDDTRQTKF